MHKEGQPNQALAPTGSQGREKRRAENDSTLGSGWATRLCGTYLGYGYRVIEVYPPSVSMQVLLGAKTSDETPPLERNSPAEPSPAASSRGRYHG